MALVINGVSPTEIKVVQNGTTTDLTVLKYGSQNVWGKPFSLSITQGANTTVTVSRTSSPNQRASTGALSSGSVVYYGDVLNITASANSGYNLSTFTVNGTAWTSGNIITVTSAITVVTTAQSAVGWHTIWTGSLTNNSIDLFATSGSSDEGWFTIWTEAEIPSNTQKLRVTGTAEITAGTKTSSVTLTEQELKEEENTYITDATFAMGTRRVYGYLYLGYTLESEIYAYAKIQTKGTQGSVTGSVTLTKVEVYY